MKLYFDPIPHKYVDDLGFDYISTTTLIHKYVPEFKTDDLARACARIGANPNHPKYEKYKGMQDWQIKKMWKTDAEDGCRTGNFHHDKLEDNINLSMFVEKPPQIKTSKGTSLFTIDDILDNPNYGRVSIEKLRESEIYTEYPEVHELLVLLIGKGFSIYVEIGLFDFEFKVSGLGDIIPINLETREFYVLDWKTNKVPIIKRAGYFDKDNQRNVLLDKFIASDEKLLAPLAHLPNANYYTYGLQLNTYQRMIELRKFKCCGRMIIHIRHERYSLEDAIARNNMNLVDKHVINFVKIENMQREVNYMFEHNNKTKLLNTTPDLFNSIY